MADFDFKLGDEVTLFGDNPEKICKIIKVNKTTVKIDGSSSLYFLNGRRRGEGGFCRNSEHISPTTSKDYKYFDKEKLKKEVKGYLLHIFRKIDKMELSTLKNHKDFLLRHLND